MGLSSAWKKAKKLVKGVADLSANTAGYSSWSGLRDAANDPLSYLSFGTWAGVQNIDQIVPQTMGGFAGNTFKTDIDMPDAVVDPELVGTQQTDNEGGSNVNRRRRASSYATSGGALGDSSYATSGIRSKLG